MAPTPNSGLDQPIPHCRDLVAIHLVDAERIAGLDEIVKQVPDNFLAVTDAVFIGPVLVSFFIAAVRMSYSLREARAREHA